MFSAKLAFWSLGLTISNLCQPRVKDFKFCKFFNFVKFQIFSNFVQRILNITNFLWVLGGETAKTRASSKPIATPPSRNMTPALSSSRFKNLRSNFDEILDLGVNKEILKFQILWYFCQYRRNFWVLGFCAFLWPTMARRWSKSIPLAPAGFKNFLQNFGDESQFWWFWDLGIDFKILKKSCKDCYPILGPILANFDFGIWIISQSYNKPPWRIFDFLSNFEFCKIWNLMKLAILVNFEIWILSKFGNLASFSKI